MVRLLTYLLTTKTEEWQHMCLSFMMYMFWPGLYKSRYHDLWPLDLEMAINSSQLNKAELPMSIRFVFTWFHGQADRQTHRQNEHSLQHYVSSIFPPILQFVSSSFQMLRLSIMFLFHLWCATFQSTLGCQQSLIPDLRTDGQTASARLRHSDVFVFMHHINMFYLFTYTLR